MENKMADTGKCLCGSVQVKVEKMSSTMGTCHCGTCRQWGSGPFFTVDCGSEVTIEDQGNLGVFDSSEWAERGFCKNCGTHIFYRLKGNSQYFMSPYIMSQGEKLEFDHQVFIDKKPSHYGFVNKTKDMTEAELFAMFADK